MAYSLLETIYHTKKDNDEETGGTASKEEKNINQRTQFFLSHASDTMDILAQSVLRILMSNETI